MADEPCDAWATINDVRNYCAPCAETDNAALTVGLTLASAWLFRLSGRRWPGLCSETVRPVARCDAHGEIVGWYYEPRADVVPRRVDVATRPRTERVPEVRLGRAPIVAVTNVTIDGATLAPSAYRVDDRRWLVRQDGNLWPAWQDLAAPDGADGTWSVTFAYGEAPPSDGVVAAAVLACEIALAIAGNATCRLPRRVQSISRQGMTAVVLDPMDLIDRGRFGIPEVDGFLATTNPGRLPQRSAVVTPDTHRSVRRTPQGGS